MAKVINRSSSDLEVFGNDAGTPKRWILPATQNGMSSATAGSFQCQALRAPSGSGVDVFGSEEWWEVLTDEVHVYDFGSHNVSLHCIPPLRTGGQSRPGYQKFNEGLIEIPLDSGLSLTQPAPAAGLSDGELDRTHILSGELFGAFVRTRQYISVRLYAYRESGVSQADLDAQLAKWKENIEKVWNQAEKSTAGIQFDFECDWVEANQHYTIKVCQHIYLWPPSMFLWSLDMDDYTDEQGRTFVDHRIVSAHEFGHFLGLTDGYVCKGELPWLSNLINSQDALKAKKPAIYTWKSIIAAPLFGNKERAKDRAKRRCTTSTSDIMTTSWLSSPNTVPDVVPNLFIPRFLVDVIDGVKNTEYKVQSLCWHERLF